MSTIRLVEQHPGVAEATTRLRHQETTLWRAEEQIKELQRKRSQAEESALEAEVSACQSRAGAEEGIPRRLERRYGQPGAIIHTHH